MAVDGVAAYERCEFAVPAIVQAAVRRAREVGFANACLPEQGRLLEVLARGRAGGASARRGPVDLLAPGAGLVIDDFSPMRTWPPHFAGVVDAERLHWLEHPLLLTTEIRLTASASALVAMRR
jgi:hypothetical protein